MTVVYNPTSPYGEAIARLERMLDYIIEKQALQTEVLSSRITELEKRLTEVKDVRILFEPASGIETNKTERENK